MHTALWCYKVVLSLAPAEFRRRYGPEAVLSLEGLLLSERRQRGRLAALRLWMRAMADGLKTVRRERALGRGPGRAGIWSGGFDDLVYVFRSWRHAKAFATTAILTVGLGLGLNAGIFSFADGFLFRPLPFGQPDRLFRLGETGTISGGVNLDDYDAVLPVGPGMLSAAEWDAGPAGQMQFGDQWVSAQSVEVSPRFEDVMGFRLLAGRGFRDDEHQPLATTPCWLSYEFWRGQLGGDPRVLGRHFTLASLTGALVDLQVVGLLPASVANFDLDNRPPDFVIPSVPQPVPGRLRQLATAFPIVRLAPQITPEVARARLQTIVDAVQAETPGGPRRLVNLRSLRDTQVRGGRPTAWLVLALALSILLLVVVNLAHLLLARAVARTGEIAVRLALGASRWRVVRLLLLESTAIAGLGLLLGLALGWWLSSVIHAYVPRYPTGAHNMSLVPMSFDRRVSAFTAILAGLTALISGVGPAWRRSSSAEGRLVRALIRVRESLSGRTARVVLAAEVAMATVIMVGTSLVGVSAWQFLHQPLGFNPEGRYHFFVSLPAAASRSADALHAAQEELRATIASVPGVRAVTLVSLRTTSVEVDGHTLGRDAAIAQGVDGAYFETLGVSLLAGRTFTRAEDEMDAPVGIIEANLAARIWPGVNPLGRQIADSGGKARTVIGVVPHLRWRLARETPPTLYVPLNPTHIALNGIASVPGVSAEQAEETISHAAAVVLGGGRTEILPLRDSVALRDAGESEFQGPVVVALGTVAFVLAAIGLYGLVTYVVEQRVAEFGVRLALGAPRGDLWMAVVRQSVTPAAVGVLVGLVISFGTDQLLRSLLFGVTPTSPTVLIFVAVSLIGAAVLASVRPAYRVLRIDPVRVLRAE